MSVDFDAIARAGRCDVSSLRLALPLLEQGYTPPFLARYRRDELSGIDEASLWELSNAVKAEQQLAARREELKATWEQTSLRDPAIGHAIGRANTSRALTRISRLLKSESSNSVDDATQLAVRVLNPRKGDGTDFAQIASNVEGIQDASAAVAGLDQAIAKRLLNDPRIMQSATRWLARNARIHIESISDPHGATEEKGNKKKGDEEKKRGDTSGPLVKVSVADLPNSEAPTSEAPTSEATSSEATSSEATSSEATSSEATSTDATSSEATSTDATSTDATSTDATSSDAPSTDAPSSEATSTEAPSSDATSSEATSSSAATTGPSTAKVEKSAPKKSKKVSPRQRRRRWLVSVLKPLSGKRFKADKLSAFQIVMIGRALRSQVAKCAFEYDATKLVAEILKTATSINRPIEDKIRDLVLEHEANIREAAESAWWDDLAERASARLVNVTANHLRRHVNRGGVDAKVILSIDAVGPRTAAAAIVTGDGRLLHSEDIPCQVSATQRSQAVTKMGELIHHYHVDLIVISNGPARRATMIALGDLIKQSPEKSVRWTLADRSGADAYSGSSVADQEMKSTPRRFRAAAWLAFSILQPAQAITKVDPLKLRLSSFQRELSDDAILAVLEDVLISGASRGGVDVNSAPVSWLARLPGMTAQIADAIDKARRQSPFTSRDAITELESWESVAQSRQAIPFLRVFGSDEALDGTLVHPEDYVLAHKLAKALEIELPPGSPPGYESPDLHSEATPAKPSNLTETESTKQPAPVEDFTSAGEKSSEFAIPETDTPAAETDTSNTEATGQVAEPNEESETPPAPQQADEAAPEQADEAAPQQADEAAPEQADEAKLEQADNELAAAPEVHGSVKRPIPDQKKISKCVKEWQIGSNRANQIVQWLCDPFGDSDVSGTPPAVMSYMPTTHALKPGDQVVGVIVSVMPFGVFVELAPDCSGLIHVSRISESYVEDLHEAVQVGDIVSAWVTGIDEKRRRVGLSAVSPERAKALEDQRSERSDRRPPGRGGQGRGGQGRGGQSRGGQSRGGQSRGGGSGSDRQGNRAQASNPSQAAGNRESVGTAAGKRDNRGKSGAGRGRTDRQGGRGQGGGRDRNRGGRGRERRPESYRVVSKEEVKPISEEMQKGKEPMRTFGDLAQFFGKDAQAAESKKPKPKQSESPKVDPPKAEQPSLEPTASESPSPQPERPTPSIEAADVEPTSTSPTSESPTSESPTSDSTVSDSTAPDAPTP